MNRFFHLPQRSKGAAMSAALQSPQGQAVVADIGNYATIPPTIVHYDVKG